MLPIDLGQVPGEPAQLTRRDVGNVGRAPHAREVGDRRGDARGRETIRLAYRPARHEASVGVTSHVEPLRIGDAGLYELVDDAHEVLEVAPSPVANTGVGEVLAVAVAPTRVRQHDKVTRGGERLVKAEKRDLGMPAMRPAVDLEDRGHGTALAVSRRVHEERFDAASVPRSMAGPPNGRPPQAASPRGRTGSGDATFTAAVSLGAGNLRRSSRPLGAERDGRAGAVQGRYLTVATDKGMRRDVEIAAIDAESSPIAGYEKDGPAIPAPSEGGTGSTRDPDGAVQRGAQRPRRLGCLHPDHEKVGIRGAIGYVMLPRGRCRRQSSHRVTTSARRRSRGHG